MRLTGASGTSSPSRTIHTIYVRHLQIIHRSTRQECYQRKITRWLEHDLQKSTDTLVTFQKLVKEREKNLIGRVLVVMLNL